ncbi:MAG TPA: tetratricopeptide repeat protein, partial [Acidobacteriota bacterium]|nr:tetratricopeptide repeat protein [Acidobacteriota bacterium]
TLEQLRSLGYVSAGTSRTVELNGEGIDPKDRTEILKLIEDATTTRSRISSDERIALLRRALSLDPTNSSLYYLLGEAYEKTQRDDEAIKLYQTAIEREVVGPARIYSRMATIYGRQGRITEAIEAFKGAVSLDPTDLDTQNRLAVSYLLQGDTASANKVLKDILALDDTNAQAYNSLGWLALRQGNDGEALSHFTRALELNPELLEAYINLGMLYKKARNFTRARVYFETFLAKASPQKHKDSIARVKQELAELNGRSG